MTSLRQVFHYQANHIFPFIGACYFNGAKFFVFFFSIFYFPQHPSLLFSCLNNWSPPPSLLTVCGREMHSVGPAGDPDALPDFFCGYAWSTLLVPSWGSFLRLNALSVTQSQVSCWHLPFVFWRVRMAGCACFLPVWRSGWLSLSVYRLSAKVPHSPALCAHAGSHHGCQCVSDDVCQALGVPFEGICRCGIRCGLWAGFLMASKKWLVRSLSLGCPQTPGCSPSLPLGPPPYTAHLGVPDRARKMRASNSFSQRRRHQGLLAGFHLLSWEKPQAQEGYLGTELAALAEGWCG